MKLSIQKFAEEVIRKRKEDKVQRQREKEELLKKPVSNVEPIEPFVRIAEKSENFKEEFDKVAHIVEKAKQKKILENKQYA